MASATIKCLITGGNGFLGRWIVEEFIKRTDYSLTILDIFIPTNAQPNERISYIQGDITDKEAVRTALKGHHICIHVASPPHHFPAEKFKRINIEGTQNVIDACLSENVGRLVYTSSASVLQDGSPLENADETFPIPKTFIETYAETKAIAEGMILRANCDRLLTCSLRPSGIFGPGDTQGTPGFLDVMKKGQHVLQIGDNSGLFDWTYVENVAYSHVLAAQKLVPGSGVAGQAFFITNGTPTPFWNHPRALMAEKNIVAPYVIVINYHVALVIAFLSEMASLIKKMLGKESKEGFTRVRVRYISFNRYFNINKARTLLGYAPVVGYKEGIKRTMAHFIEQEELEAKKTK
ncbi:erg26, C-3 sterol dehydrogenase [Lobosporangium transversale]|uniref:3-beta hydroxysteroid dehydrogenase/isomerase family-domain-containing protein n=1 Tax=Lobosporangium transversale TaxID=64571 RepID=A0A1Y2GPC1_9FUNG|nr:3-beta hydroxysteroid dehydrogenase/isomerase family-domain-containing protein [Lobosporangium transversale]KAF9896289.1 erg26, C-3 sterol dehydrogenase [Lobosporangium transversale]ORZ17456.1 3-beta hydroxysteroid dehydrogenase/isomerase family-domain-containing protein [Lobosporangium transversale]|eukprot:XP_021881843.1 3-beta hydroxysteroid dehydrogenase/isomerase family-domain-containing protein [Lobosporangium transversale]